MERILIACGSTILGGMRSGLGHPGGAGYTGAKMLDRFYLPLLGLIAAAAVALALVWPQGLGDRSPAPFGHEPIQRTAERQAAMKRETEAAVRRLEEARAAVRAAEAEATGAQPK